MNMTSLRINAVKGDESSDKESKNAVKLDVEEFWSSDIKKLLSRINDLPVGEAQMREFKKFTLLVSSANPQDQNEKIAKKLMKFYFEEKLNQPAKKCIQSSFNRSDEQTLIIDCIKNEISTRIDAMDFTSSDNGFDLIKTLNEASQNFPPATTAIGRKLDVIIVFMKRMIWIYDQQLRTEVAPAQKNKIANELHLTLKVLITCIRSHLIETDHLEDSLNSHLADIKLKCCELLDHPDLPMDAKNNCSMLVVIHSNLNSNEDYIGWMKDENSSYAKKLTLIFGIVNTLNSSNFNLDLLADISVVLKDIFVKSTVDPSLMLSIGRSYKEIAQKLASINVTEYSPVLETITASILSVALLNLEHHMDKVFHLSRETLSHLAVLSEKLDDASLSDKIFTETSRISTIYIQSIVIISIIPSVPAKKILDKLPDFHYSILSSVNDNITTNHYLISCYEALGMKTINELEFVQWFEHFIEPVLKIICAASLHSVERVFLEILLVQFIKEDKKVLDEILKRREQFDVGLILLCLSAAKKTGHFDKLQSTEELWKANMAFKDIQKAMINSDDTVRTSALSLIVESRKTVDVFTVEEFDCVMYFFKYNINVQAPSTRQAILGLIKNFFVRIQSVLQNAVKKADFELIGFYFEFLTELHNFCLENLCEGANFTRRVLSLRLLFFTVEAIAQWFPNRSSGLWDKTNFKVLMDVMNDSFEDNKKMAIEIMNFIPKEVVRRHCTINLKQLEVMVTSIKPPESLTSMYLMEIFIKFTFNFDEFDEEKSELEPETLLMLTWCEKLLLDGLERAEKSLIVASSLNPLYGLVQSIRHLLSKINIKKLGGCHIWRNFFKRLIVLCRRLTLIVAPVVNSTSPEGVLPNEEIKGVDRETRYEWEEIVSETTPQIVLLCCWRTIKEVSLLLGDISLKVPIIGEDAEGLLSVDEVLSIGDHFLELLSKTKHRGAFEQCFFGFSQICIRLWTCTEPELHKLPSEMLEQMISSLSGQETENNEYLSMKKLCATRRSAGLPFMVQALITSELKVSRNKNFHFVMKNLIQFSRHGEHLETRTHSLNILRTLFRCSDLGEAIAEYISEGMQAAILGYGAESWLERNSATLLFSALMVRIFGVQRTKDSDDLGVKNKMTERTFFSRYPELHNFILTQLYEASDCVKAVKMNSKLHPLLLLLIRLYPSPLEGSDSKLELSGFIPVVSLCSGCVELQTRVLCAKFIAIVTPPTLQTSRVMESIKILSGTRLLPANVAHGILLQILHLVKAMPDATNQAEWKNFFKSLPCTFELLSEKFQEQPVCYVAYMDIVVEIVMKCWTPGQDFEWRMRSILERCAKFTKNAPFGLSLVHQQLFLVLLMVHLFDEESFPLELENFVSHATHPVLDYYLLILDFDYGISMQDEYEIDPKVITLLQGMGRQWRAFRKRAIEDYKSLFQKLTASKDYRTVVKSFDLLSLVGYKIGDCSLNDVQRLIMKSLDTPEQHKKSLLKYASVVISNESFHNKIDYKFLIDISTDASFYIKSAAADFVESIHNNFSGIESCDTLLYFTRSVLLLLMDDEQDIRERMSRFVAERVHLNNILPCYAQEKFIEFMMNYRFYNFDFHLGSALITLVAVDDSDVLNNSLDKRMNSRVFEKNDVNIFSETFTVKKFCSNVLRNYIQNQSEAVNKTIKKIVKDCQSFKACKKLSVIESYLQSLFNDF